jgi:hypothetical protein
MISEVRPEHRIQSVRGRPGYRAIPSELAGAGGSNSAPATFGSFDTMLAFVPDPARASPWETVQRAAISPVFAGALGKLIKLASN